MFTLSGAVDIEIGDGTVGRLGVGDILIAEDLTGQVHATREVGRSRAFQCSCRSGEREGEA